MNKPTTTKQCDLFFKANEHSTLKWQRTETSRFQVSKTEREMRVPSKHSKKDLQTTKITDAEKTFDSKYWCADHIKRENGGRETVQKSVWDLLAPRTWIKTARQQEYSRQEEDIWYNRSAFPTLCPFAGSSTPQHSEAHKPQLQSDGH